jgi:hypothetical protein
MIASRREARAWTWARIERSIPPAWGPVPWWMVVAGDDRSHATGERRGRLPLLGHVGPPDAGTAQRHGNDPDRTRPHQVIPGDRADCHLSGAPAHREPGLGLVVRSDLNR